MIQIYNDVSWAAEPCSGYVKLDDLRPLIEKLKIYYFPASENDDDRAHADAINELCALVGEKDGD